MAASFRAVFFRDGKASSLGHPLSFIRLALLKRLRNDDPNSTELLTGVLESINGIASGLKNTG